MPTLPRTARAEWVGITLGWRLRAWVSIRLNCVRVDCRCRCLHNFTPRFGARAAVPPRGWIRTGATLDGPPFRRKHIAITRKARAQMLAVRLVSARLAHFAGAEPVGTAVDLVLARAARAERRVSCRRPRAPAAHRRAFSGSNSRVGRDEQKHHPYHSTLFRAVVL